MTFVTVVRHVPRPIIGMIGTLHDPEFERFEANLDWLETTGVLVEQFDPVTAQQEVAWRTTLTVSRSQQLGERLRSASS
jgi:hypothetical protein